MKRLIALVLCLVLALSLAACGKKEDSSSGTNGQTATVQRENGKVIFTMSKNMLEIIGVSADDIVASTQNSGQVIKNDDGSVTYKMSEEEYDQLLSSLKKTMDESIESFKTDETLTCIKDITYNDDLSEIIISAEKESFENNISAALIPAALGISGMFYQMYTGVPDNEIKCSVVVKDSSTGEEFQSVTYPDAIEEAASGATVSQ
ncbi:hypothetical protein [Solibaculum mannosilyticum]|uniref:DUF4412 domain-containing protein n=1 Tax=Solibaculum mannosilyticum TaxID=2780922 RepID=A0A7I8D2C0_9FIRM|nr:hypothetical protein [Solibaculum mannosilyticum]BCI60980.1 hypothetical protein C12CBH8_16190 [Solibaculum mannosilyticum]CZT55486.1 hypothetical protein BN3661_00565 [Eubacteriaceae bacterium CHKCI005]